MIRLSDTQMIILSTAGQRPDGNLLPLPGSLRGGAAGKVVTALLTRGLVCEQTAESLARADTGLNTIWRNDEDGRAIVLRITATGREVIGVEPTEVAAPQRPGADRTDSVARAGSQTAESAEGPPATRPGPLRGKVRQGTKQAALIAMLKRPEGATIAEIVEATGWQPHTVRGAFAGALKKRLGLEVNSEKIEGRGRVYALA